MNSKREKIGYTIQPEEKLSLDQWMKEFKVGRLHVDKQAMHNANEMMKQYNSQDGFCAKLFSTVLDKLCVN